MLKITSLAIGLLTVLSIAPRSAAMTANSRPLTVPQPAADRHAQLIIKIGGGQPEYHHREEEYRHRQWEIERAREREREAERRRREYYSRRYHDRDRHHEEYRRDEYRGEYRGDYHRH